MKYLTGKKRNKIESKRLGYIMTIPATILILLVSIYPLINGIILSLKKYNVLHPDRQKFIGLENFVELFHDSDFIGVLGYTFFYTICYSNLFLFVWAYTCFAD